MSVQFFTPSRQAAPINARSARPSSFSLPPLIARTHFPYQSRPVNRYQFCFADRCALGRPQPTPTSWPYREAFYDPLKIARAHSARRLEILNGVHFDGRCLIHAQHLISVEIGLLDAAILRRSLASAFTNADVRALSARILFRDFCAILVGHRSIAARKNSPDACLTGALI